MSDDDSADDTVKDTDDLQSSGYLSLPLALCNECRTPLLGSHLVYHRVIMSVRH